MSVLPLGVGWGVVLDRGHELVRLTAAELTQLGHGLYQLLSRFTGYQAAQVGWDPQWRVDPAELRREWADELAAGNLSGLILAEDVLPDLRGSAFVPFALGFLWIPYAGEHSSMLAAGKRTTGETSRARFTHTSLRTARRRHAFPSQGVSPGSAADLYAP